MLILSSNPDKKSVLAQLIRDYVKSFPSLKTREGAYNKCKFASYELVLYLRARGYGAKLIHVRGCTANYTDPHPKWSAQRRSKWSHYVVGLGRYYIDVTARQFDSEAKLPQVGTLTALRGMWTLVEEDKFLNSWVSERLAAKPKV